MHQTVHTIIQFSLLLFAVAVTSCTSSPRTEVPSPAPPNAPASGPTLVLAPPAPTSAFIEATPSTPLRISGTFVYAAGDGSLWTQAADGGAPVGLLERSTEAIAQMPAFTPDGTRVIFAALLFLPDGNLRGDIRAVNVATGAVQPVVQAPKEEIVYFYPRPAQDGRLLVTRIDALQTLSETARLEWVDVQGGGERTTIVRDARDGDVSRDGSQIAFVRYEVASMRSSLWVADAEGKNERRLVAPGTFVAIQAPRFSPDGEWLAFSVHGAPQEDLPRVSRDCAAPLWLFCFAQTASAHSAPGAVWRVNLTNGKFQQLTDIYDDSPVSAWGSSDTQLAIHDFTGIRLIDLARQEIYPLYLEDGGLGGFDWYAP